MKPRLCCGSRPSCVVAKKAEAVSQEAPHALGSWGSSLVWKRGEGPWAHRVASVALFLRNVSSSLSTSLIAGGSMVPMGSRSRR